LSLLVVAEAASLMEANSWRVAGIELNGRRWGIICGWGKRARHASPLLVQRKR